jgi:predicted transcriptional regulator
VVENMALSLKKLIIATSDKKAPGPPTTFTPFHIYCALELLSQKPIGRNKLANKIGVGDGTIRTIINRLKNTELISNTKEGCTLTHRGQEVWRQFEQNFPQRSEIPKTEITPSEFNYGFMIKGQGDKIKSGIDQRDAAIIAGAKRAIVLISKQGALHVASVDQCIEEEYTTATKEIRKKINPQNDKDVIIIAGAETPLKAKTGAFAAAWILLDN